MARRMPKRAWIILAIVIITIGVIIGIVLSLNSSSPPDLTLPIIIWDETTLSELEGTPLVLNFWSISCGWCRYQLPFLEAVAQQSGEEVKVIAINMRDNAPNIQKFFGDYKPAMIIALDENREAFADYCMAYNNTRGSIPFTLFVDSEGVIQYVKIGAFTTEAELWNTLNSVFGTTVPQTS